MNRAGGRSRGLRSSEFTILLALTTALACRGIGTGKPDPTSTIQPEFVTQALRATPHRLAVVYWPAPGGCSACDAMVAQTLTSWLTEAAVPEELLVLTVLPKNLSYRPKSLKFPGRIVEVEPAEYGHFAQLSPQPRIEIWSGPGELLMLRSIPNYSTQVALLDGEYLAARSFTAPLPASEARSAE